MSPLDKIISSIMDLILLNESNPKPNRKVTFAIEKLLLQCVTRSLAIDLSENFNLKYGVKCSVHCQEDLLNKKFSVCINSFDLQSIIKKANVLGVDIISGEYPFIVPEEIVFSLMEQHASLSSLKYKLEILRNEIDSLGRQKKEYEKKLENQKINKLREVQNENSDLANKNEKLKIEISLEQEKNNKLKERLEELNAENEELIKGYQAINQELIDKLQSDKFLGGKDESEG